MIRAHRLTWLVLVAACGATRRVPSVRFANAPAVTAVDDRRDVPATPEKRAFYDHLYHYDGSIQRRLTRALELPGHPRARGVNALDEVPDSTWFTNRIGARELTLDELRAGPAQLESPELHKPWTITSTKVGGTEVGFIITDARGLKFLLKFDPIGFPEQETATHVIVGKLLWACGFHTTEDYVVLFRHEDLVLAPGAKIKDDWGHEHALDRAELERRLATIEHDADGGIRGMASRWLAGKPLGGHPAEGVREDDPNDRIPHELRRDLRGAYAVLAWLDHVDIQESNFIDMWAADARDPERHYVEHYMIDFGKSLGVMATTARDPRHGYEYTIDVGDMARSLVTAGTELRSWETRKPESFRGIGMYSAEGYDPGAWKPDFPSYVPLVAADRFDNFWASKIMMRLDRAQIHAIVETGRFTDPRATEYLTNTLVARQRATAAYWFARVNPLDRFAVDALGGVCFDDLAVEYDLGARATSTRYTIRSYDRDGRAVGVARVVLPDANGHVCVAPELARGGNGYTIVRVETMRPGFSGVTFVHVAPDPATGALRVIGIWRT
jgi:hypothetical protein